MAEYLGIEFIEITPDCLIAKMPVDHRTIQPYRLLNGGASFALAEILGSVAANIVIDRTKFVAVGLDMNGNHLKPVPEGQVVYGYASGFHLGKTTQVWDIQIKDEEQNLVCICRLTMIVKSIN